jgi:hypothetical protein
MSDLRERLEELADVAARHGRTPGPQAALRRARQRRLLRVGATAVLLAVVLVAAAIGVDRLAGPAPLLPAATTTASTSPPEDSTPPDVNISPDPGEIQRPVGSPPGRVGEQMVRDVATIVAECRNGVLDEQTVLVAWGRAHGRTWLIAANPQPPAEGRLCWADGLFEANGAGGMSNNGGMPLGELRASGNSNLRDGDQYWGYVNGAVTKRAARVRVLFDLGIPPLDLEPIQAGNRFPVNFFAGFYRMPGKDARPATWQVVGVVAYDEAGRKVAECRVGRGPGVSC